MNGRLTRRELMKGMAAAAALPAVRRAWAAEEVRKSAPAGKKPNILLCLSDDQSCPHASAYGASVIKTPNFDRVAKQGVLFNQA